MNGTNVKLLQLLNTDVGTKWREEHVETSHFTSNKDIDNVINETENLVTNELEGGDRQRVSFLNVIMMTDEAKCICNKVCFN